MTNRRSAAQDIFLAALDKRVRHPLRTGQLGYWRALCAGLAPAQRLNALLNALVSA